MSYRIVNEEYRVKNEEYRVKNEEYRVTNRKLKGKRRRERKITQRMGLQRPSARGAGRAMRRGGDVRSNEIVQRRDRSLASRAGDIIRWVIGFF
jgi:hypothetical protein